LYGKYKFKQWYVANIGLFPIGGIKTKNPMCLKQDTCNYTTEGRKLVHNNLKEINQRILQYIIKYQMRGETLEFNDNRISLYVGQNGKCSITGEVLEIGNMEVHHKTPKSKGGTDEYNNLTFVTSHVHKLIHAVEKEIIDKYKILVKMNEKSLGKLNKLRIKVGNCVI
jgi:CRISPR/Cas system Type II protein with McrA/HNH and RuvC-like nuclease domain